MSGWNSNIRCYVCGGRGHPESECQNRLPMVKVAASKKNMDGRARPAQPAFEFIVNGLTGVSIRDKYGDENEVGMFGVVVTSDELRVMTIGDRISFFGTPALIREFALSLPDGRHDIAINWSVDRVSVEGRFAISRRLCRTSMSAQPFVHEEPEFSLLCRGPNTNKFVIQYRVDNEYDEYVVNHDSRNQVWVIPAHVHEHLSQWMGVHNDEENAEEVRGEVVGAEVVVGNIDAAPQVPEDNNDEPIVEAE